MHDHEVDALDVKRKVVVAQVGTHAVAGDRNDLHAGDHAAFVEARDTHGLQRGDIGGLLNVVECPVQQSV